MTPVDKNYQRAIYFYENKIPVHIKKSNGTIFNGLLKEPNPKTIEINDRFTGNQTVFLFDIEGEISKFIDKGDYI